MVDPLRKGVYGNHKLGHNDSCKFSMELLLAGIGVCMILQHLERVTSGPEEVDGLLSLMAISVDGNFSEAGTWVTPTMGT